MRKLLNILGLKREAMLFDSKLYIIKAILAIATGYLIGKALPITRLDMISVLLGVMYNLEPINMLGIKSGVSQLIASTIGAACTAILILLFGINVFTIAAGMALTLFVSLKMNWRMVSPVAIFTCIYMTQYVQLDASGNPSIWLTYRLRVAALGLGVIVAILYNYLFSFLYYRKIAYKRLEFSKGKLINGLEYTQKQLEDGCQNQGQQYINLFPSIFNDLDLVYDNISIMINETKYFLNLLHPEKLKTIQKVLRYFRDINHLAYDINFTICSGFKENEFNNNSIELIKESIVELKKLNFAHGGYEERFIGKQHIESLLNTRIDLNIKSIIDITENVIKEAKNL